MNQGILNLQPPLMTHSEATAAVFVKRLGRRRVKGNTVMGSEDFGICLDQKFRHHVLAGCSRSAQGS